MARRLIGLDVGTNAVTLAEVSPGTPPRLERFGQVALPPDAMREGEVVDDRALIDAISRLRAEVDVKKAPVRLGLSSPRAVVRQVEMPAMSRDDFAGALKYQAADLIPIPMDEAVLDFAILDNHHGPDGEALMTVLLVAAHEAPTARLAAAVESAGFSVAAVDLLPLALIRALAHPAPPAEGEANADNQGAEGIVSFGGGVTAIAVHENGTPRFVRVLGTGGRELTDAIAVELNMPTESAEALKRQLAQGGGDELVARARSAIERPLAMLLDDVRSSLDYYRNQPGATRLLRVVVTGGASQLPGLADRLGTLVGLPIEHATPRAQLAIGDIRFPESEYPRLDPYLPASVGLALGGAGVGTVVDLAPRKGKRSRGDSDGGSLLKPALAVAAGLIVVLGIPTFMAQKSLADKKDERTAVQHKNEDMRTEIASKADIQAAKAQVDTLDAQVTGLLSNDVSWPHFLQDLSKTMPDGVWLTSFQAQVDQPVVAPPAPPPSESTDSSSESTTTTTAPAAAPTATVVAPAALGGTVTFSASGNSYSDVSAWLRTIGDPAVFPALNALWVSDASQATGTAGQATFVNFTSNAHLTDAARSHRLENFRGVQ
jgi:type IV pilus assembly protein PilM